MTIGDKLKAAATFTVSVAQDGCICSLQHREPCCFRDGVEEHGLDRAAMAQKDPAVDLMRVKDMVDEKDRLADERAVDKKIKEAASDYKKLQAERKDKAENEGKLEETVKKGLAKLEDTEKKVAKASKNKKDLADIKKTTHELDKKAHEAKVAGQTETTLKGKLAKSIGLAGDKKAAEVKAEEAPPKLPEKKYTEQDLNTAVHQAANTGAKLAIKYSNEAKAKSQAKMDKDLKGLEEAVKDKNAKVDEAPTVKLTTEIKRAVMEEEGVTDLKPDTGAAGDDGDKALRKNKGALYRALDGITNNPKDNGLNAAATAAVSITQDILNRSSIDQEAVK